MVVHIQLESGEWVVVPDVIELTYVKVCPYLEDHQFETTDHSKVFCTKSHKQMYWLKNHEPVA